MSNIEVRIADWHKDNTDLRRIRERVFIDEQGVSPEQEWDSLDASAIHFLAIEDGYAMEQTYSTRLLQTEDAREATRAAVEKRAPVFKGR